MVFELIGVLSTSSKHKCKMLETNVRLGFIWHKIRN